MSFDLDKAALDRWITTEPDGESDDTEEIWPDLPAECDKCGWMGCVCATELE